MIVPPVKDDARYRAAIAAFDSANAQDPNHETVAGRKRPHELVQAERFTAWLERLQPDAPEELWLAVRCQHIRRWERPRSSYPEGRQGYLRWRRDLGRFHAEVAGQILEQMGYEPALVERVRALNQKKSPRTNVDTQTVEDVLCLSFIAHELEEFSHKHPREKLIDIIHKTWSKMSDRARSLALGIELSSETRALIEEALAAAP